MSECEHSDERRTTARNGTPRVVHCAVRTCERCDGDGVQWRGEPGTIHPDDVPCHRCGGTGLAPKEDPR